MLNVYDFFSGWRWIMSNTLNIQLTNELRRFVDERASDDDVYSTPSEYIRDLIRRDYEKRKKEREQEIASMLMSARQTPVTPLENDFFSKERDRLKERTTAKKISV